MALCCLVASVVYAYKVLTGDGLVQYVEVALPLDIVVVVVVVLKGDFLLSLCIYDVYVRVSASNVALWPSDR